MQPSLIMQSEDREGLEGFEGGLVLTWLVRYDSLTNGQLCSLDFFHKGHHQNRPAMFPLRRLLNVIVGLFA